MNAPAPSTEPAPSPDPAATQEVAPTEPAAATSTPTSAPEQSTANAAQHGEGVVRAAAAADSSGKDKAASADPSAAPSAQEASAPSPSPSPTRSLFEAMEFDRSKATAALSVAAAEASSCKSDGEAGPTTVHVTFASSGRATNVSVDGPLAGTPAGACIARPFSAASVPPFAGDPVTVSKTVVLH